MLAPHPSDLEQELDLLSPNSLSRIGIMTLASIITFRKPMGMGETLDALFLVKLELLNF